MKITNLIEIIILVLIFSNCQRQNTTYNSLTRFNIVDLNKSSIVKLSELDVNDVQYVPLQTDTNCLISVITKLIATDNTYVIFSNGKFYQFDFNGSFINQIGTIGRGPQEYQFVFDFTIDNEEKQILIPDMMESKIIVHSLSGKFVKSIPCPKYTRKIFFTDEGILCRCDYIGGKFSGKNSTFIINYEGDTVKIFSDKYIYRNTHKMSNQFMGEFLMCNFNENLYVKELYSDTVFILNNLKFKPAFILDHGGKTLSVEAREQIDSENSYFKIVPSYCTENKLLLFGNFVFSEFSYNNNLYKFIGSFDGKSFLIDSKQGIINDIDGGPNIEFNTTKGNHTIISWTNALKLKSHVATEAFKNSTPKYPEKKKALEKLANSLNENDNPVLMLVKLKE